MKRLYAVLFSLMAVACSRDYDRDYSAEVATPAYAERQPRLLVDAGHHNRHSVDGSYKPFAALARSDGYALETLDSKVTAEALARCDVFVIPSALGANDTNTDPAFTPEEVEVIARWVAGGGSLLLITDHHPFGGAVRNLGERLGVEMHDGMTFDPVHHERTSRDDTQLLFTRDNRLLASHPITNGRNPSERVSRVLTFTGQSIRAPRGVALLTLSDTAEHRAASPRVTREGGRVVVHVDFARPASAAGYAQAVALTHGKGRVVVLAEAAMASAQRDGDRRIGMNAPGADNRQFVLNTLHWLTRLLPEQ